jgi:peroxiredoxin (alkyl hydroperoxide reductase subunit C)
VVIGVGEQAPLFALKNQNNQVVRLEAVLPALVVFYPLAFTGTCQGELTELRDAPPPDVTVLTISVDSVYAHKVWADREGYDFALLADFWPHGEVARAYGVFNAERGVANRGTFLVDRGGTVRFAEMNEPGEARDQGRWRAAAAALAG